MYFKQKTRPLSNGNFHSDITIFILVSLDFLSDTSSFDMSGWSAVFSHEDPKITVTTIE